MGDILCQLISIFLLKKDAEKRKSLTEAERKPFELIYKVWILTKYLNLAINIDRFMC